MAINIDPKFLPSAQSNQTGAAGVDPDSRRQQKSQSKSPLVIPSPANLNVIPSPQSLDTQVNSAVELARNGVTLDRGTILNLLI